MRAASASSLLAEWSEKHTVTLPPLRWRVAAFHNLVVNTESVVVTAEMRASRSATKWLRLHGHCRRTMTIPKGVEWACFVVLELTL